MIEIGPSGANADLDALLVRSGLAPVAAGSPVEVLLAARLGPELVGCAAVERYGDVGLLRSVATDERYRGTGIGRRLVESAAREAVGRGIRTLYLLTETARSFFERLGYNVVARDAVPEAVRASDQFTTSCPASATAMARSLHA